MCSGRVDPAIVLGLLAEGADGVMVTGCHIGDCHYINGNLQAKQNFALLRRLLEKAGLEAARVRLEWVSASEGQRFAGLVREFTDQVKELGSSPLSVDSPDPAMLLNMRAAKAAAKGIRLRTLVGKEGKLVAHSNQEEFDKVMTEAVESEYNRHRIRLALMEEPTSVKKLSERLGIESNRVLENIVAMRRRGWVKVQEIQGTSPIFGVLEVQQ